MGKTRTKILAENSGCMNLGRPLITAASLLGLLLCASCSHPVLKGELPSEEFPSAELRLVPGDVVDVKFLYWPELNAENVTVRQDGKIALQIIDEVKVAGLTPDEMDDLLTEMYKPHLKDPVITVNFMTSINNRIFVGGEVPDPGPIPIEGRVTLLSAVVAAGGVAKGDISKGAIDFRTGGYKVRSANLKNVIVFRQVGDKRYAKSFNIQDLLESSESDVFYLAPNDIVYVTRSGIDKANQWVDQYINKMVPETTLYYRNEISDTETIGITR
ncbi:MAG: polysaccharide biosynthesis/export family protein [Candidatus Omnitrophica bacterium]|nr:polysaccharide biosynthesis/export family protein [Candidatus Omnitrophota bacterium]